jgi:glycerophosphoryl diester phosphodiesterase
MPELRRPLLLGHRGARSVRSIPENTLESFDRALADGCDGFEFDVRLTADEQSVICHNPRLGKLEIARASAADLPTLPQLQNVLSRYRQRAFLDIELKVGCLEKITVEMLREYPPERGFVVSSFVPDVLQAVRAESPHAPLGLICETETELRRWTNLPIQYVILHRKLAGPSRIAKLRAAHKRIFVWTVNRPAEMRHFHDLRVDGIISDDTSLLRRTIVDNRPHDL